MIPTSSQGMITYYHLRVRSRALALLQPAGLAVRGEPDDYQGAFLEKVNMDLLKEFHGPNAGYVLDLYEKYRQDPSSVDAFTRAVFERWTPDGNGTREPVSTTTGPALVAISPEKVAAVVKLASAIRSYGHLSATLDPLGTPPRGDPELTLEFHGLTEDDLRQIPAGVVGGPLAEDAPSAYDAIEALRQVYTTTIGYEYGHIRIPEERDWLRHSAECGVFRPPQAPVDSRQLLQRLTQVEVFEQFLQRTFPGKTRFSIEGLDMMIPMLDELIAAAAEEGIRMIQIGMAHRGRLNVLAHILGRSYDQILAEFKDPLASFPTRDQMGWTGDVKYHKGARREIEEGESVDLVIDMPPNPSHLEHVDPVLLGMARAAASKTDQPGPPQFFPSVTLPVLIHGDASFPGQGVVAETLNMSRLDGYSVGGSIHLIANNQLGFTTSPEEGRSTMYASDLAKGFQIPIIHVNADDPVGCLEAIRTAFAYRQKFHKDFLVDIIGYRRYGHNEGDEPEYTQPKMYAVIEKHPSVRRLWADRLVEEGAVEPHEPDAWVQQRMDELQGILDRLEPEQAIREPELEPAPRGLARNVETAVPLEVLREINAALLEVPPGFNLHRKIARQRQRRQNLFDDPDQPVIDWSTAEELALATILADGVPIRFSGEDSQRGTFSQRHAVLHDVETGETYVPLQSIPQVKAAFEIINSPLSENAAIGFELGYDFLTLKQLVIWEAQYGDFINAAQAMIDEYLVSARAKWEYTPSMVLLLPHGYEGQGPDHSSGRPERFLQLCADINMRVANCTTAAQYFHLLRRQAALVESDPLPLVVLTPKSLLRHPMVFSPPREFAESRWQAVIDDLQARENPERITKLVLCSGKIYVDMVTSDLRSASTHTALVRVEQLYPYPQDELGEILASYPRLNEVVWVQEEPQNMGAWEYIAPRIMAQLDNRLPLRCISRPRNASPAEGSTTRHAARQAEIIRQALE